MNREDNQRETIVRLFQISNALQTYMDKILSKDKVTTKQFFMMIILGSFITDPMIGEVSERFGTSRQNVKQVLLKLQKNGFVNLYKDDKDSRITRAALTEKSQMFWNGREQKDMETMNSLFSRVSDHDLETTKTGLVNILNQIMYLGGI